MSRRHYGPYSFEASNEDKLLFAEDGIRKADLIEYYERVASAMLVYVRERALMMHRFPDGIDAEGFYQKQIGAHFPAWIQCVQVGKEQGGRQTLVVCNNEASLAYLAHQACITPHLWLSRTDKLDYPDQWIIDLDPPTADAFETVRETALRVRALCAELGVSAFVKTTGSKGLHVSAPLDRSANFERVRAFVERMARVLERRYPDSLTTEQRKDQRGGRLFVDVGRNAYAQTAVAAYAVRPLPGAPVATPLGWDELENRGLRAASFGIHDVPARLDIDPWSGFWRKARSLASMETALEAVERAA